MLPAGADGNDLASRTVIEPDCVDPKSSDYRGIAVVYEYPVKSLKWRNIAMIGVLLATALMTMPHAARAEGLFDFFFGGFQRQSPPAGVNSYAEPPASIGRVAPQSPSGTENVRQGGEAIGRAVAFC